MDLHWLALQDCSLVPLLLKGMRERVGSVCHFQIEKETF